MSDVVEIEELGNGIVKIIMKDKLNKNTFSKELAEGLIDSFKKVGSSERYKVVILTGYDSYFASGGTKEGLLAISEGKLQFTDENLYSLALNCPIPVISAMQGHGIGGGFVMGMFADFVILSRESIYTTNFMKYGFTPGMGGTFILPQKLGVVLAHEMMTTANNYRGEELKMRGVPFKVLPRSEVVPSALELATSISEKPRISLVTLKNHLVSGFKESLIKVVQQEVEMHDKTFHTSEVRERISSMFGQ